MYSKVIGFPGFWDFRGIFGFLYFFALVLVLKINTKLFLKLLPSFWAPGMLKTVLRGSFRGLGCSKKPILNGRDPDSNRIQPFRAFVNAFMMKR